MKKFLSLLLISFLVVSMLSCNLFEPEEKVFEKSDVVVWECRNCGHLHIGVKAPKVCPVCAHPEAYFEVRKENY